MRIARYSAPVLLGLGLLAVLVLLRYLDPPPMTALRLAVLDQYQRLAPRPYPPMPVRIVDVDEAALAALGQWPWPRTMVAELVRRLGELEAAVIAFDFVLAEPDRTSPGRWLAALPAPLRDELRVGGGSCPAGQRCAMAEVIERLPDFDTLLAETLSAWPTVLGFAVGGATVTTPGAVLPDRSPRSLSGIAVAGTDPAGQVDQVGHVVLNLPLFESAATGQGSLALGAVHGGIVRQVPLLNAIDGQLYPSLAVEALRVAQGASTLVVRATDASGELRLGEPVGVQSLRIGAVTVPSTTAGQIWLYDSGPVRERYVSAARVLAEDYRALEPFIAGHIVLIGSSAPGLRDLRSTPLAPFAPGVEVHAQILEQMLAGQYLQRPDWVSGAELLFAIALGLSLLGLLLMMGAVWAAIVGAVAAVAAVGASWLAFQHLSLLVDPVFPSVAALLAYLGTAGFGRLRAERQRRLLRDAFSSYLAPTLVDQLAASPEPPRLGGEAREMTFLFTDIAGFTSLTEQTGPAELVRLLNDYLDRMCGIVTAHGGTVDKIVGDAVVAFFNAPIDQPDHAERAVRCALTLQRASCEHRASCNAAGIPLGETRIGVNTGVATVGNFGGTARFDYTAYGDAVNTAARLEGANKYLGTRVCIAAATAERCRGIPVRPVAELVLKGKTEGIQVFVPAEIDPERHAPAGAYEEMYAALAAGEDVGDRLAALQRDYPDDPLLRLHAARVGRGESGVRIIMAEK
jgi:adenylate cyclase